MEKFGKWVAETGGTTLVCGLMIGMMWAIDIAPSRFLAGWLMSFGCAAVIVGVFMKVAGEMRREGAEGLPADNSPSTSHAKK